MSGDDEVRHLETDRLHRSRPTQLHITHSWGGGTARWVDDFQRKDTQRRNLILRSVGDWNHAGRRLDLIDPSIGETPLLSWELATSIRSTDSAHEEYRRILAKVIAAFDIRALLVSSFIGHAMDVLDSGLPTALVLHDLYPYCPAMFGYFETPCVSCQPDRLNACMRRNPDNEFWHNTKAADWLALREAFTGYLARPWLRIVAPTRSVRERWSNLLPVLVDQPWHLVGHGVDPGEFGAGDPLIASTANERLRIVVPGRLDTHKGLELLRAAMPALCGQFEILLLGCGEFGQAFDNEPGVNIVPHYRYAELGQMIRGFAPDVALLLSILPESFSYTLSEMFALGLPVAATRLGAFAERIEQGVTGMLFDPNPDSLVASMRMLTMDRAFLSRMRTNVAAIPLRNVHEMIRDYHALLPIARQPALDTAISSVIEDGLIETTKRRGELAALSRTREDEIRGLEASVSASRVEMAALRARTLEMEQTVSRLQVERDSLLSSRSWRFTAPLRRWAALVRRYKNGRTRELPVNTSASVSPPSNQPAYLEKVVARLVLLPEAEHMRIRHQVRANLGMPDASRIVLVLLPPVTRSAMDWLDEFATACVELRNDIRFVMPNSDKKLGKGLVLLASTRRLFFSGDERDGLAIDPSAGDALCLLDGAQVLDIDLLETVAQTAGLFVVRIDDTPRNWASRLSIWLDSSLETR